MAVTGTLKGFDQLMNLVLDDVKEAMRGMYLASLEIKREGSSSNNFQMMRATRTPAPWV